VCVCECVCKCTSNKYKTEKLKQDFKTSQLIVRVDHVSSKRKKRLRRNKYPFAYDLFSVSLQQSEDQEVKRPEVKAEDLIGARDKLAFGTEVKSKTFEVMQECGESSSKC